MVNTFAALRTQVGIAKEATKFTGVPPTAFIPVTKFDVSPKVSQLKDAGWRGSMGDNFGMQNGTQYSEVDVSGDCYADTFPWFLAGLLGDVATTGASSPYTHKVALLNSGDGQPKSYTLTDNQAGVQARQVAGCQFSEVTLKFDASGMLTYDAKALGKIPATASTPTATYSALVPLPSWLGALTLGGSSIANIESGEVSVKRQNAEALFGIGAQDPYNIHVGGIEVTSKFTFIADSEGPLLDYLSGTSKAFVATFSQGANASLAVQLSSNHYDDAKVTRGKAYVTVETTGQGVLNATDVGGSGGLSPILCTAINALPSGTYV